MNYEYKIDEIKFEVSQFEDQMIILSTLLITIKDKIEWLREEIRFANREYLNKTR